MLIHIETQKPWNPREAVTDRERKMQVRLPPNIEQLWSDAELAAVGLKRAERPQPKPKEPEPELSGPEKARRFLRSNGITVADLKAALAEAE